MSFFESFHIGPRAGAFCALAAAVIYLLSCSSDPPNTLGSDSDLIGSEPGTVSQDTIGVFDDTTYVFNTPIAGRTTVETGVDSLYEHIIVMQPGFADLNAHPGDTLRTVSSASLHLGTGALAEQNFLVRFYRLGRRYTEGDTITIGTLPVADAILDPVEGTIERNLELFPPTYPLPPSLVQTWIRDVDAREAIAIVYTDTANERVAVIDSQDGGADADPPYLDVLFTDNVTRTYEIRDDATAYRARTTTSNLIASDGVPRRVFLRAELDSVAADATVHNARIRFHIVPGTVVGTTSDRKQQPTTVPGVDLLLYIPDSTDPATSDFKNGQRITDELVLAEADHVDFPLTNAIFLILQGTLKNNGFAIRMRDENTKLRQIELYGTDAPDSLRPKMFITTSTPAVFD